MPDEAWLAGYPGPAVVYGADGRTAAANTKGQMLAGWMARDQEAGAALARLLSDARAGSTICAGTVMVQSTRGEHVLEVTVMPLAAGVCLCLGRDVTLERNLRAALVDSRQRYKDIVEASSDFYWETDAEGRFVFVSPKGTLGYTADELVGQRSSRLLMPAQDGPENLFLMADPIEEQEVKLIGRDGQEAVFMLSAVPVLDDVPPNGEEETGASAVRAPGGAQGGIRLAGARGLCRDVTEARRQEAALETATMLDQSLNYIASAIRDELVPRDMLNAAVAATCNVLDVAGARVYRLDENGGFKIGSETGDVAGLDDLNHCMADLDDAVTECVAGGGKFNVLVKTTTHRGRVNGAFCVWRPTDAPVWDRHHQLLVNNVAGHLGVAIEQIRNLERIVQLSRTDALTGLLNRRAFLEEELPRRFTRLMRDGNAGALFYVDLDNFKLVNDTHGHQRGDEALMTLRDMLMEYSRPGDLVARLGGDEFAMWFDRVDTSVALSRAEALAQEGSVRLGKFSGHETTPLGLSIGVAVFEPESGETLEALMLRADEAMYAIKRDGKGGARLAVPSGT